MRVVIDGLAIRGDNSLSIVSQHLLAGWEPGGDEVHLVVRSDAAISIPDWVTVHRVNFGRVPVASRLRAQSVLVPRLCRTLAADVMLGLIPATTVTGLACPRAVIAWDFRYRFRPEQFSRRALAVRRLSYAIGFRQADGVACISRRTKRDLLSFHRRLGAKPVGVAHLGADHVVTWPARRGGEDYAIAFGHFANKNVELVLRAWALLHEQDGAGSTLALHIVGVPESARTRVASWVDALGLGGVVTVSPWMEKSAFEEEFASSNLVVFPSDFEGFGLPAVEAMRLGIPVVITADPALLEVTGGHATVVDGEGPEALARAVVSARAVTPEAREAALRHAATFTWSDFAASVRRLLGETVASDAQPGTPSGRAAGDPPPSLT